MHRRIVVVAALALGLAGLARLVWLGLRPRPTVEGAAALAQAGRFDEALAGLRAILDETPDDPGAHVLAAQVLLDRPSSDEGGGTPTGPEPARLALEHLRQIRTDDPALAALALFNRGKAEQRLGLLDEAEASWLKAIDTHAQVAEAGWALLELYYLQSRSDEARRLALRLHEVEPDPRDRVQFLLELLRQDAQPPAPGSLVAWFEPVVARHPGGLRAPIALGLALVHAGEVDRGIDVLRGVVASQPSRIESRDGLLTGLDDAGQLDALAEALGEVPAAFAESPRLARHRARAAQERGDWPTAVRNYRLAVEETPHDLRLQYRLVRALRLAGDPDADRLEARQLARQAARDEARPLYLEADATPDLGLRPRPALYQKIADQRERQGLLEEARAWHRLVLRDRPEDPVSRAALARFALHDDATGH